MSQDGRDRKGTFERTGEQLGEAAGRAMGRGTDMAAGMIGSLLGSAVDTLGEWWSSADAGRAARSFDQQRDRSCREHFESTSESSQRDYDAVRPLYQFGHMAQHDPSLSGRGFEEVEPTLRDAYRTEKREKDEDWSEVRGYVGFGYSQEDPDRPPTA
jgi:hypothetical protein